MKHERGNILFLILLAVVLFAALSYAITGSNRGQVKDAGGDKAKLAAGNILQIGSMMANATNRLMLTNDCRDTDINFDDPYDTTYAGSYANTNRADGSCNLFGPTTGLEYPVPDIKWLNPDDADIAPSIYGKWYLHNKICVDGIGTGSGSGCSSNGLTTDTDLVVLLPYINKALCNAINDAIGVARVANDGVQNLNNSGGINLTSLGNRFKGTYGEGVNLYGATENGGAIRRSLPNTRVVIILQPMAGI